MGNKITPIDEASAYIGLRTEAPGVNSYLSLNAKDHDQEENQFISGGPVDFVEAGDDDTTIFELGFTNGLLTILHPKIHFLP